MAGCVKCGRWFWNRSGDFPPICSRCAGLRPAAGDASAARAVQRPTVTWALASACVFVFLLMTASGASVFDPSLEQVVAWGGDFGPATLGSDWWRLVTATFVHVGLLHLALNMWCLLTLGPIAERVFGRGLFFLLYLVSGVAGSATSLLVHPLIVGAGASGAIFGVAGALGWGFECGDQGPGHLMRGGQVDGILASASRDGVAEGTWQTNAREHYRRSMIGEEDALRQELADRVASLTGCCVGGGWRSCWAPPSSRRAPPRSG